MKLRAILMAAAMTTTILASTRVASAQQQVVATIPFDFAAGAANLPAGDYSVKTTEGNGMLLLINRDNPKIAAFVPANPASSSSIQDQSKLVFNRYGDRYFLSQVWTAGNATGRQLAKSAREKESAMIAKSDTRKVILVASLSTTPR